MRGEKAEEVRDRAKQFLGRGERGQERRSAGGRKLTIGNASYSGFHIAVGVSEGEEEVDRGPVWIDLLEHGDVGAVLLAHLTHFAVVFGLVFEGWLSGGGV